MIKHAAELDRRHVCERLQLARARECQSPTSARRGGSDTSKPQTDWRYSGRLTGNAAGKQEWRPPATFPRAEDGEFSAVVTALLPVITPLHAGPLAPGG